MSQPVRAARAAVAAGAVAMLYVVVLFVVKPIPDWALGLLGGPDRAIDRRGGLVVTYRPDGGQARRLEYPGVSKEAAQDTLDLLRYGGLVMQEALETDYADQLGPGEGVTVEIDRWRPEDGSSEHAVPYLRAATREALQAHVEAAFARGVQLPPGTELGFELVEPFGYDGVDQAYWRTYLLSSEVLVDGTMIESAMRTDDPYTNRPTVLLEFTRAGADAFCEHTGRLAGKKLATVLGGRIRSAPIINGQICGGRASITVGAGDALRQEREAESLVAVLRAGAVPPGGGTVEDHRWRPPIDVAAQEWLARLVFGLFGGLACGALVLVAVRLVRPTRPARLPRPDGRVPWRRVAVTALAPAVLIAGSYFTLPGIDELELAFVLRHEPGRAESVFGLGLTPVLAAFVLVELVALVFPRLRWRRHDPLGRVGLGRAVAYVAVALAIVQGYVIAQHYALRPLLTTASGWKLTLLVTLSLAAGTMLLAVVAGVIREHGLGNGYAALIVSGFALDVAAPYLREGFDPKAIWILLQRGTLLGLAGAIAIAAATRALLRWRVGELRTPTCGLAPVSDIGGLMLVPVLLASLGFGEVLWTVLARVYELRASLAWSIAIVLGSVPLWAWLFARPAVVEGVTWRTWVRATGLSLLLVGGADVVAIYTAHVDAAAAPIAQPVLVMLATAAVLDVRDELRARRRALVPAGIIHQAQYVPAVEAALAAANIPGYFHAAHVRTLLQFFGPFAPIVVLVPEAQALDAREKIYAAVTREHREVVRAFARDARPTPARPLVPAWARTR